MEEKKADITIKTLQRRPEGTETMEERAEGTLRREGEDWLLFYREGMDSGLGDTRATLRLEPGRAILTREGETTSQMVFQVGEPHVCRYATPYGELTMAVETLELDMDFSELGGQVFLIYKLRLGQVGIGENRLRLTVKTKENGYDR